MSKYSCVYSADNRIHIYWTTARQLKTLSTSTRHSNHMSAWQIHEYGDPDQLTLCHTARIPVIRSPNEILVEVHAASINPIDIRMTGGYGQVLINMVRTRMNPIAYSSEFPLTLGRDFSGVVVQTGTNVSKFKRGDQVWGALGAHRQGTHADFAITSEKEISKMPESLDHFEAASMPYVAATTWMALVNVGELKENSTAGKRVLVNTGAGGIGTFAIQLLKAWDADVTTICNTDAVSMLSSLGADRVIDSDIEDIEAELHSLPKFDLVLDSIGKTKFGEYLRKWKNAKYVTLKTPLMKNTDKYGIFAGGLMAAGNLFTNVAAGFKDGQSIRWAIFNPNGRALNHVAQLVDSGKIKPVVEKVFSFDELPRAYDTVSSGHARGKTVIQMK